MKIRTVDQTSAPTVRFRERAPVFLGIAREPGALPLVFVVHANSLRPAHIPQLDGLRARLDSHRLEIVKRHACA
jgi:hypothetical protein